MEIVKELDPTRPVTAGCNEPAPHNNLFRAGAMDIIGFNCHERLHKCALAAPGYLLWLPKPLLHCRRGFYQMPSDSVRNPKEWWLTICCLCSAYDNACTGKYLNLRGLTYVTMILFPACLCGPALTTWASHPSWWPSRSSYFGIIDLAGFPKDVYYMYQSEWTDTPVLHVFPHWNWSDGETVDLWVYYNRADSVELFLNGASLGIRKKTPEQLHTLWRVAYEPGTVTAVSYSEGKEYLRRSITTAGEPAGLKLTADRMC